MRALKFLLPLAIFLAIFVFLYQGLSKDPSKIPSPLVGRAAPSFSLPILGADRSFSPTEMRGKVWLLNVWGSWCAGCLVEHPLFVEAARTNRLTMVGLAWKDRDEAASAWLKRHGNPYAVVVSDLVGNTAIDYGVYGAPESFLIDKQGVIRYKKVGPFAPEEFHQVLLPMIGKLQSE